MTGTQNLSVTEKQHFRAEPVLPPCPQNFPFSCSYRFITVTRQPNSHVREAGHPCCHRSSCPVDSTSLKPLESILFFMLVIKVVIPLLRISHQFYGHSHLVFLTILSTFLPSGFASDHEHLSPPHIFRINANTLA